MEEEGVIAKHVTRHGKEFGAKRSKGKGTNVESNGEGEKSLIQSKPHYTRGRWPKNGLVRCDAFGDRVAMEARIIAQSLNKDVNEVMLRAGLGLKFGKKNNASEQISDLISRSLSQTYKQFVIYSFVPPLSHY